jgi:hypothetical protein
MTLVQIDDRLYVEALQYVADQDKAGGAIQMLEGWLSGREEDLTGDRVGADPHARRTYRPLQRDLRLRCALG